MPLRKLQHLAIRLGEGLPLCLGAGALPDNGEVAKAVIVGNHARIDNECVFFTGGANKLRCAVRLVIDVLHRA